MGLIPAFGPFKRAIYPLRLEVAGRGRFAYLHALDEALHALGPERAASTVRVPTLLIYGERDLTAPPAHGERLARALPTSRLQVLPGETHLSTPIAAAAGDSLLEWVELHTGGTASNELITPSESAR
jgi:pimeloyl-ACP methyl ester carboxylesterase